MCHFITSNFTRSFRLGYKIIPYVLIATLKQIFTMNMIHQDEVFIYNYIKLLCK